MTWMNFLQSLTEERGLNLFCIRLLKRGFACWFGGGVSGLGFVGLRLSGILFSYDLNCYRPFFGSNGRMMDFVLGVWLSSSAAKGGGGLFRPGLVTLRRNLAVGHHTHTFKLFAQGLCGRLRDVVLINPHTALASKTKEAATQVD